MNGEETPGYPPTLPPQPPLPSLPPHPPKKNSALPWILGGCGCLFIVFLFIAVVAGVIAYRATSKPRVQYIPRQAEPSPVKDTTAPSVPAGWATYVNTKDKLPEKLQAHFVGFSFSYPADKFKVTPDDTNFIKVEENLHDPVKGDFTMESFSVGYMFGPLGLSSQEDQDGTYPTLLETLSASVGKGFPNYKELAQITEHVGGERGRALIFQAEYKGTSKGDIKFFGKLIVARHPGQERGVAIIMLATPLDPAITSPADVGTKGDMAAIVQSFKLTE